MDKQCTVHASRSAKIDATLLCHLITTYIVYCAINDLEKKGLCDNQTRNQDIKSHGQ